ncbi:MAG: IS1182 family transposase [Chloroflexota bacterium]|nr:IS1182 family transposase [Chloroflexota bacterium]
MTLQPQPILPVPEATANVARAAFPNGNIYLHLRDELGTIYDDTLFAELYPRDGQPAASPWRLALVTVLQFAENLPDRQAADAVRRRSDWKYLLGLALTDPGFDYSVLCEFRARLIHGDATELLLERLLELLKAQGIVKHRGRQRTDSTHILAAVRDLSRLELVGTTLLHALNSLAVVVPDWLIGIVPTAWSQRYNQRWEAYRLPNTEAERLALATQVGQDGFFVLAALYAADAPAWVRHVPAVETLRHVWVQNFSVEDDVVQWRRAGKLPPAAQAICSPFDPHARSSIKRQTEWTGYKVHLTEICDPDAPHLITHVTTTAATTQDNEIVVDLHQALAHKDLLPREHLVDQGYSDSHVLMQAHDRYAIELLMPMRTDHSWQAQTANGYALSDFQIDWEAQQVMCPEGKTSASWVQRQDKQGHPRSAVMFNTTDCAPCPARTLWTHSKRKRRKLTIRPHHEHALLHAARTYQHTEDFRSRYAVRAGIEGTIAQAVVALAMRRSRYRGAAKTHLQHIATAVACTSKRVINWWNDVPFATTTQSRFSILMAA